MDPMGGNCQKEATCTTTKRAGRHLHAARTAGLAFRSGSVRTTAPSHGQRLATGRRSSQVASAAGYSGAGGDEKTNMQERRTGKLRVSLAIPARLTGEARNADGKMQRGP